MNSSRTGLPIGSPDIEQRRSSKKFMQTLHGAKNQLLSSSQSKAIFAESTENFGGYEYGKYLLCHLRYSSPQLKKICCSISRSEGRNIFLW